MKFNNEEKKAATNAVFIALADLIAKDKSKILNYSLLGIVLRHYIITNHFAGGQLSETEINRQIINLLVLFLEKTEQRIRKKGQIPEAFTPIKFMLTIDAQIDPEGTTIPARKIKIDVTPEMIKEVNDLIVKLGHETD